ncbi:MAG: glycosyltransferase family 9 protein [Candidatus Marinimicrobia bacterium]|nr:glycosyltransferase family 9 protein [Candidatus Neomarinimicrobiota bacterium]
MNIKGQQIFNPEKLAAARFLSWLSGSFNPSKNANKPLPKEDIKRILVQEHQCIGDVLMLEPTLAALKESFPDAEIDLLCTSSVKELAQASQLADRIMEYPKELPRPGKYDLVIDFHADVRRLRLLKGYKAKYRAGFSFSGGAKWLTHVVDYPFNEHQVERPFELLTILGVPVKRNVPLLKGFDSEPKEKKRILLHPGANHEARKWPREHWVELIKILKADDHNILWLTPPGEKAPEDVDVFSGSIVEMAKIIKDSCILIGCDSMSVHLSIALGTPALAIFGSQDPELTKPYGPNGYFIIPEKECKHRRRDWRLCKECMRSVSPENVFEYAKIILNK